MPDLTIEDAIGNAADEERRGRRSALPLLPLYLFLSDAVHIAKGEERQAIIDSLRSLRQRGPNASWNEGFHAAKVAVMRMLIERHMTP